MLLVIILSLLMFFESLIGIEMVNSPPTKNWHKWAYRIAFSVIGIAVIVLTCVQYATATKQDKENNSRISDLTNQIDNLTTDNSVLTNHVVRLEGTVAQLIDEFATNSATADPIRLAILNDESEKLGEQIQDLQGQHEVASFDKITLQSLRNEHELQISNRDAIAEYQRQQAQVQQQIASIQAQEQQRHDQQQAEINAEQEKRQNDLDQQEFLSKERNLAKQILPIFDYTLGELNSMLAEIAGETKTKLYSDFPGAHPTIYFSEMVSNGIVVDGHDFIQVGTNTMWRFRILTAITPKPHFPVSYNRYMMARIYGKDYDARYITFTLTVRSCGSLKIKPMIDWRDDESIQGSNLDTVLITLNVPDGLSLETTVSSTNYETIVNKALRGLIEAADEQHPLPMK